MDHATGKDTVHFSLLLLCRFAAKAIRNQMELFERCFKVVDDFLGVTSGSIYRKWLLTPLFLHRTQWTSGTKETKETRPTR